MLALMLGFCRQGSAEYFQFSTTTTIGAVAPSPINIVGNNTNLVTVNTAGGTPIQFTGLATSGTENLVAINGGTDLVFGLVDVQVVNATPLQNISIPFTFNVTITDYATDTTDFPAQGSAVFTVTGMISGKIGAGRKVNMSNIIVNPVAPILIGSDLYAMTFNTIVPPGPFFPGAIGAHVEVVPEPSSVALLGLGLVGIAIPAIRRRRNKSAK